MNATRLLARDLDPMPRAMRSLLSAEHPNIDLRNASIYSLPLMFCGVDWQERSEELWDACQEKMPEHRVVSAQVVEGTQSGSYVVVKAVFLGAVS